MARISKYAEKPTTIWRAALYFRLSKDDGDSVHDIILTSSPETL